MIHRPEITHNALAAHGTRLHADATFTQVRQSLGEVRLSLHEENLKVKGGWARQELHGLMGPVFQPYLPKETHLSDHPCSYCVPESCRSPVSPTLPHPTLL